MSFENTTKIWELFQYIEEFNEVKEMTPVYYDILRYAIKSYISGKKKVKALREILNLEKFNLDVSNKYSNANLVEFINLIDNIINDQNKQEEDDYEDMPELITDDESQSPEEYDYEDMPELITDDETDDVEESANDNKKKWEEVMNPISYNFNDNYIYNNI